VQPVKRAKHYFQPTLYNDYHIVEEAKKLLNGYCKRFNYVMLTKSGKIEILGITDNDIYFKYHQAKNSSNSVKFFSKKLDLKAGWLERN
jgi:L-lysine 2,3-aminomutase